MTGRARLAVVAGAIATVAGCVVTLLRGPLADWKSDPWVAWLNDFTTSAGFGGLCALGAAIVALKAASLGVRQKDRADRREAWWEQFRWVAEHISGEQHEIAAALLLALESSGLAGEDESRMVAALAGYVFQTERPDLL